MAPFPLQAELFELVFGDHLNAFSLKHRGTEERGGMLCVLCASVFQILSLPVSVPIHNSMETIHEPLFMKIDQQSEAEVE